ncbi:hypothetical protein QTP86_015769 [Hemibagrus guttatus]|nr:hypothetical protein QTP86_015769 [Hemibagrus guttatus]
MDGNDEELSWTINLYCIQFIFAITVRGRVGEKKSVELMAPLQLRDWLNIQGPYTTSYLGPLEQRRCLYSHICKYSSYILSLPILAWLSHDTALLQ